MLFRFENIDDQYKKWYICDLSTDDIISNPKIKYLDSDIEYFFKQIKMKRGIKKNDTDIANFNKMIYQHYKPDISSDSKESESAKNIKPKLDNIYGYKLEPKLDNKSELEQNLEAELKHDFNPVTPLSDSKKSEEQNTGITQIVQNFLSSGLNKVVNPDPFIIQTDKAIADVDQYNSSDEETKQNYIDTYFEKEPHGEKYTSAHNHSLYDNNARYLYAIEKQKIDKYNQNIDKYIKALREYANQNIDTTEKLNDFDNYVMSAIQAVEMYDSKKNEYIKQYIETDPTGYQYDNSNHNLENDLNTRYLIAKIHIDVEPNLKDKIEKYMKILEEYAEEQNIQIFK